MVRPVSGRRPIAESVFIGPFDRRWDIRGDDYIGEPPSSRAHFAGGADTASVMAST